jgi:Na+/melibiose symporter-like transporter
VRDYAAALANPRFAALLALAAIPAKIIVIAFCFYLVPLYVAESGHNAAMAGRIIMLYSVMMVLGVPITTEVVERIQRARHTRPHAIFVAGGLVVSGLAGLLMLMPLGLWGATALVFLLGIAQAMSIAPQSAMVADVSADDMNRLGESAIYGVYRMVERLGNAMGPVIAAFLLQMSGFNAAFAAIGAAVLLCGIAFYATFRKATQPAGVRA